VPKAARIAVLLNPANSPSAEDTLKKVVHKATRAPPSSFILMLAMKLEIMPLLMARLFPQSASEMQDGLLLFPQSRGYQHFPFVIKRDQTIVKERVEIGGEQETVLGIEPFRIGRFVPRLDV
jgi:hypothetical protein